MDSFQLTQHVANVNNNMTGLRGERSEDIAHREACVRLTAWTDLQPVFSITLEQKRKTSNVCMASSPPGTCSIL